MGGQAEILPHAWPPMFRCDENVTRSLNGWEQTHSPLLQGTVFRCCYYIND
jgi:hypothetical protein